GGAVRRLPRRPPPRPPPGGVLPPPRGRTAPRPPPGGGGGGGGGPPADLEPLVRQLGADSGVRITVIDRSGRVLAESELDPGPLEDHASRPEFQQAVATGRGQAVRHSRTLGIDMLYAAEPLAGGQAVLRLAAPLRQLEAVRRAIRTLLLVSVLAAGGLALAIATLLVRRLSAPLAALQDRVDRLAQGDLGARVRPEGSAELQRV